MSLKVKYWGVCGSLPTSPNPEAWSQHVAKMMNHFFEAGFKEANDIEKFINTQKIPKVGGFGTATTCVEVNSQKERLIIDGGSGIKHLGDNLISTGAGRGPFHIFLTHFHWDHLIGLPFFVPHFIPGTKINYYAVQPELEEMVRSQFKKPNFPVPYEILKSQITFNILEPRVPIKIGDIQITPYKLDHPDPCWGFRIESGQNIYAHCVDTECTRQSKEAMGADLPLYQNADLMYFDAQYTLPELAEKANWGHSAAQIGLEIAVREKIKCVLFAHHNPGASIDQIYKLINQTNNFYQTITHDRTNTPTNESVKWDFAYEGMEVDLSKL